VADKTCIDCGVKIQRRSTRCNKCAAKIFAKARTAHAVGNKYRLGQMVSDLTRAKMSASRIGRRNLKYHFNEHAFDILTPQAAYWLGFIYADGYIQSRHNALVLTLKATDKSLLEAFRAFLHSDHPIIDSPYFDGRIKSVFIVRSPHLIIRLAELGVYQKKSFTIKFPDLPRELQSDFIRGYFDGDGCLTSTGGMFPQMLLKFTSGAIHFLESIQVILMRECCLGKTKLRHYKNKNAADLVYGGNKQVRRIADYLLKHDGFFLDRKLGQVNLGR
jgi:DNA-directed RNA polymerase subunit RPC12/RpoP